MMPVSILDSLPEQARRNTRTGLQRLMVIAAVVPLLMFFALGWHGYARTLAQTGHALQQTTRIVHEHAAKVLQTNEVLLDRAVDLVNAAGPETVRAQEMTFRAKLRELTAPIAQSRSVSVFDAQGRLLTTTLPVPASREVRISDRKYFVNHAHRGVRASSNEVFDSRLDQGRVFSISKRVDGPDGDFGGVVVLALSTDYFKQFYEEFAAADSGLAVTLFRSDGEIIARYPPHRLGTARYAANGPLMKTSNEGIDDRALQGTSTLDNGRELTGVRQVAGAPVYVAVSRTWSSVLAEWRYNVATLAMFVFPTWLGLMLAVWTVRKRASSEDRALMRWHAETTRRTRAEDQLRQLQKYESLGELTGGLAHDFNNLLNVVSATAAVLTLLPRDADMGPYLSALTRAVTNGGALTRHLLAFARQQPLTFVRMRTNEAIPPMCELARLSLPRTITLGCEVDPDVHDIIADGAELELAIINMAVNAKDAMPDGGVITVRARNVRAGTADGLPDPERAYVTISVTDTGTGIPPAMLSRIFEPVFTTKKGKGTGLGLSRVYGYVRQLGGHVTADNAARGGAVITLYIPSADDAATPENTVPGSAIPGHSIRQRDRTVSIAAGHFAR